MQPLKANNIIIQQEIILWKMEINQILTPISYKGFSSSKDLKKKKKKKDIQMNLKFI